MEAKLAMAAANPSTGTAADTELVLMVVTVELMRAHKAGPSRLIMAPPVSTHDPTDHSSGDQGYSKRRGQIKSRGSSTAKRTSELCDVSHTWPPHGLQWRRGFAQVRKRLHLLLELGCEVL